MSEARSSLPDTPVFCITLAQTKNGSRAGSSESRQIKKPADAHETAAGLYSGLVMFSVEYGGWRQAAADRSPSLLAGSVCEIVLLLLCAGVYVLLWRFAPLPKAVLLALLTALQLAGMFVFIKLNGWMLEKKYAV